MDKERMLFLISRIKKKHPYAKFRVMTNGVLLSRKDMDKNSFLKNFYFVKLSNYFPQKDKKFFSKLAKYLNKNGVGYHISNNEQILDKRIDIPKTESTIYKKWLWPCGRCAYLDIPINYYGYWDVCCVDYTGSISIGDIVKNDLNVLFERWRDFAWKALTMTVDENSFQQMPLICRQCSKNINKLRRK